MRSFSALSFSLSLALLSAPLVAQEVIGLDSFDEGAVPGTVLDGEAGGAGWSGPWFTVNQPAGLLSYWALDNDVSDAGAFATSAINNGATFSTDVPPLAWSSHSLVLTGTNSEFVDLSNDVGQFQNLQMGTIAVWVKSTSTGARTILAASDTADGSRECRLLLEGGKARFDVRGDLNSIDLIDSTTSVNDGLWHHIAVVVEGNGVATLYVDGVAEASLLQGFFRHVFDLDTMAIGRNVDSGGPQWPFDGQIDDLAVWGAALSAGDIANLAAGTLQPSAINAGGSLQGPSLAAGSLGSAAHGSRGLLTFGDSIGGSQGLRAGRLLADELDLRVDTSYYVSCLVRREDAGQVTAASVDLTDAGAVRGNFGWDANGNWDCGIGNSTPSTELMLDRTTYLCVLRIDAVSSGDDAAFLKVYAPGDTIDASDAGFGGIGGPTGWTAIGTPRSSGARLNQFWVTPAGAGGAMRVDEIRIGSSWDAVTRLGFGAGCGGATIGQAERPSIGAPNFVIAGSGFATNAAAVCNVGISRDTSSLGALPYDLSPIGATGCLVLVSPDVAVGVGANAAGDASLSLPIPADPTLSGIALFAQWIALDPGSANPLPIQLSDGLEILIQD